MRSDQGPQASLEAEVFAVALAIPSKTPVLDR
jgi:hypothetical protein